MKCLATNSIILTCSFGQCTPSMLVAIALANKQAIADRSEVAQAELASISDEALYILYDKEQACDQLDLYIAQAYLGC